MRRYVIYTPSMGKHEVTARTVLHAVAALVARLGLTEQQTETVLSWSVTEQKGED